MKSVWDTLQSGFCLMPYLEHVLYLDGDRFDTIRGIFQIKLMPYFHCHTHYISSVSILHDTTDICCLAFVNIPTAIYLQYPLQKTLGLLPIALHQIFTGMIQMWLKWWWILIVYGLCLHYCTSVSGMVHFNTIRISISDIFSIWLMSYLCMSSQKKAKGI